MNLLSIDIFQNHFKIIFPEIFFFFAISVILLYGVISAPMKEHKYPIMTNIVGWLSIQSLLIVVLLIVNQTIPGSTIVIFNNVLIFDDFTTIIKIIVLLAAIASIIISFDYIKGQKINSFEYIILIIIATLSMLLLVSSYDLISLYLAIELQSLSFYVIAAFQRNNEFSIEAGLKYFILGALSSGFLLFGESIIYGFTGITNFEELTKVFTYNSFGTSGFQDVTLASPTSDIANETVGVPQSLVPLDWTTINTVLTDNSTNAIIIGLIFMLIAFLFKISAVPFHMWSPDVYEGAPTSVTAFFSITPKIAILALMLRLCLYTFYDLIESWQIIIITCSILSMYIGTFGAIKQNKIKRLLAYSSIAHVGYMLIGLATATAEAIESLLLYIIVYILLIINIFGVLLIMAKEDWSLSYASNVVAYSELPAATSKTQFNFSERNHVMGETREASFTNVSDSVKSTLVPQVLQNANKIHYNGETSYTNYIFFNTKNGCADFVSSAIKASPQRIENQECSTFATNKYLSLSNPLWNGYTNSYAGLAGLANDNNSTALHTNGLNNQTSIFSINSLTKMKKKDEYIKYITDLCSLAKTNPLLAATLAIIFFSNAGVPPLAGFYGKLNIFLAAIEGSMYFLAFAAIICSVIGAFYSIRLIKIMYYHNISSSWKKWSRYKPLSKENSFLLGITFFFTIFFFLYPSFLWTLTHSAALSLCI